MQSEKTKKRKSEKAAGDSAGRGFSTFSLFGFVALASAFGCQPSPGDQLYRFQKQVESQKAHIVQLENDVIKQQQQVDQQNQQIAALQQIAPERMSKLVVPVKIELDKLTGGYEEPGQAGDAGVVAYVMPIDADGDVVKVAGSIVMDVFDLANPPEQHLVAHAELDVDNTRKAWHGRLFAHHFTVKCPWPPPNRKPPEHRDLTVRVKFTDYLTGKTFMAQTTCKIKLPADVQAAQK